MTFREFVEKQRTEDATGFYGSECERTWNAATAQASREALLEARNALCGYCADGRWREATGPRGEPAHVHGQRIVLCKAAAIRALAGDRGE